jgi:transcriptional regulator with XRE-family HTH domain
MGRSRQTRPHKLAKKLREIRLKLDLSQPQMYERLKEEDVPLHVGYIGSFETGEKVPSLPIVLKYARVAGIAMDLLVDDELELPEKLPKKRRA